MNLFKVLENRTNGLIFTDGRSRNNNPILLRYAGTYRIRTELERMGKNIEICDYFSSFSLEEIKQIIDNRPNLDFIGFFITFLNYKKLK